MCPPKQQTVLRPKSHRTPGIEQTDLVPSHLSLQRHLSMFTILQINPGNHPSPGNIHLGEAHLCATARLAVDNLRLEGHIVLDRARSQEAGLFHGPLNGGHSPQDAHLYGTARLTVDNFRLEGHIGLDKVRSPDIDLFHDPLNGGHSSQDVHIPRDIHLCLTGVLGGHRP